MKSAAWFLFACLSGVALSQPARAYSGAELYQSCANADTGSADNLACAAYVSGFIDGMIMGYTAHGTVRGYCPPVTGVAVATGRAIIEKYLREHPEKRKTEASILAGLALSEAFPCKKN
jgi:hypothetical protein